jgi:enamine deaminase RidA (YjgF/YER057c/UK114 family)
MPTPEERLVTLGIQLPAAVPGRPAVEPLVRVGDLVFVSSRGPSLDADGRRFTGKIGRDLTPEEGRHAARLVAINLLATLREELGSLDHVRRVVRVTGMLNVAAGFTAMADVLDGGSELFVEVFGEEAGRHARSVMGAAELPNDYPVALDVIVALES